VLTVSNLFKSYAEHVIFDSVTFTVGAQERVGLVGRNGSGKTTLLRLLAGIDEPESGTIRIDGKSPRMLDTGWVNEYPDRNLLFSRVYDEVASTLRFRGMPCPDADRQVRDICRRMMIDHIIDRPVRELSGGEKVLAAIAAALVHNPSLLVLDEYDSHLDPQRCTLIDNTIRACRARYIIHCTQQMEAAATGNQVIALEGGHVACSGSACQVFALFENTPFYPRSWRVFL
jgi:energy-coupling factor transport system ATP-binding protein